MEADGQGADRRHERSLTRRVAVGTAGAAALAAFGGGALVAARAAERWQPSAVPGLTCWVDASTSQTPASLTNAVVTGSVRLLGAVPGSSKIGGRRAARFTGRGSVIVPAVSTPRAMTTAVVLQPSAIRAGTVLGTAPGDRDQFSLTINDDGTVTAGRAGVADIGRSSAALRAGAPNLVVFQYDDNGIWCCFINGVAAGVGRTTWTWSASGSSVRIGATAVGGAPAFVGDVGELMQWSRPLTGTELRAVHEAMAAKWRTPSVTPITAATAAPLDVPDGLVGSNIAPKVSMYPSGSGSVWTEFWSNWDWAWVRSCIDRAQDAGSNAIRTIGDVQGVQTGRLGEEQYGDQLQQVIDHCAANGLRYYPCGFSLQDIGDASVDEVERQLVAQATRFARSPDVVVGFDLINELATNFTARGTEEVLALAVRLLDAVRAAVPGLPLTVSDIGDLDWGVISRSGPIERYARLAPHVDFFDLHAYAVPADLRAWQLAPYELSIDRALMLGEFGADAATLGDSRAAAYYDTVRRMRDASPAVRGVFQWAVVDEAFGLSSEAGATQPLIGRAWKSF